MNAERLGRYYPQVADAPDAVTRFRRFILDLAVRGRLLPQDANDEPACDLLKAIAAHRRCLLHISRSEAEHTGRPLANGPFPVPSSWLWTTFGDLVISRDGERIPVSKEERASRAKTFDYYGASGVIDRIDGYLFDKPLLLIGEDGANLINRSTPIAFMARGRYWVNNHAHVLDGLNEDLLRFLALFINATDLRQYVTGTAQPKMNQAKMNSIPVALPPLAEQRRILAKVEELMALCDRLETARAEREKAQARFSAATLASLEAPDPDAPTFASRARFALGHLTSLTGRREQVQRFRQTILSLAMRGKLVPQDANDEPATDLLERIAKRKAELHASQASRLRRPHACAPAPNPCLPRGWAPSTLGAVALKITDGTHKTPSYLGSGVPFVSVKDFSGGRLDLSNTRFISETEHLLLYRRCDPKRGDILIGRIGTLGHAVLVDTDTTFSLFVSVGLIRLIGQTVVPQFLVMLLNSTLVEAEFDRIKVGGATHTNKLNLGDLHTVALPIPPVAEQQRIVAKVQQLTAVCDQLEVSLCNGDDARQQLLDAILAEALEPVATGREALEQSADAQAELTRG